jgi:hypothetical protein
VTVFFDPSGSLDIATDPSDLPETGDGNESTSGAMTRCKNLRVNQKGQAITRDGSAKLNASALAAAINWIEEQGGDRYSFAGSAIYLNESSIESGLTDAQWSAVKYSAFNDLTEQVFALNGTDRKRISGSDVWEWGIEAPTVAPILAAGAGTGLTGEYNAVYTYVRKVDTAIVCESNPSPASGSTQNLSNQSLSIDVEQPTDPQVTHIRVYRTLQGGETYFLDREIAVNSSATYGYTYDWELADEYLDPDEGFAFSTADATHSTQNSYTWEETYATHDSNDTSGTSGDSGTVVYGQDPWSDLTNSQFYF